MEKCGPIMWPLKNPDLIPFDFYFGAYINNMDCLENIYTSQQLQERINVAISTVIPGILR
jgi:hypothetical protein